MRRKPVILFACPDLQARPFTPQIDARRSFDYVAYECPADARCHFNKVKLSIRIGFQKFSMRHAANKTQFLENSSIEGQKLRIFRRIRRQCTGSEDPALVRS